jgi:hypothetical protein
MRRLTMLTIGVLALSSLTATTLRAQKVTGNAHFVTGPSYSIDSTTGDYVVTFKEAGLGSTSVTYSLTATKETFTFQCFTNKGNTPEGNPNGQSFSNQHVFETLPVHNGQINGSIRLVPQVGTASCQGHGLDLFLIAASYSGVTFSDTTNSISFPPNTPTPLDLSASGLKVGPF